MSMNPATLFDRLYPPDRNARIAILFEEREITYEDLRSNTVRTAEALHAMGIRPGDRVAILLDDSPEFVSSFSGIISLGAIAAPINLALRQAEQSFILKDCGACAAIVEAKAADILFRTSTHW